MTHRVVELNLAETERLLGILRERIPGQYTGGVSFGEWIERGNGAAAG